MAQWSIFINNNKTAHLGHFFFLYQYPTKGESHVAGSHYKIRANRMCLSYLLAVTSIRMQAGSICDTNFTQIEIPYPNGIN